jgi:hypothetical protein
VSDPIAISSISDQLTISSPHLSIASMIHVALIHALVNLCKPLTPLVILAVSIPTPFSLE